jgi:hypothetical protein
MHQMDQMESRKVMNRSQDFVDVGNNGLLDSKSWSILSLVSRGTNAYCESSKHLQCLKIRTTVQSKDWDQATCKHKGPIELVVYGSVGPAEVDLISKISKFSGSLQGLHACDRFTRVTDSRVTDSRVTLVNDLLTRGLHKVCPNLRRLTLPVPFNTSSTIIEKINIIQIIAAQLQELKNLEALSLYITECSVTTTLASASHDPPKICSSTASTLPTLRYLSLVHKRSVAERSLLYEFTFPMILVHSRMSLVRLDLKRCPISALQMFQLGHELQQLRNLETLTCSFSAELEWPCNRDEASRGTRVLIDGLRNGYLPKTLKTLELEFNHSSLERFAGALIDCIPSLAALHNLGFEVNWWGHPAHGYKPTCQRVCHALDEVIQRSQLRNITWEMPRYFFTHPGSGKSFRELVFFNWFIPRSPKFYTAFTSRLKSLTIGGLVFHSFPLNGMMKLAFASLEAVETLRLHECGGCFKSLVEALQAIPHKDLLTDFSLCQFRCDCDRPTQPLSLLPAQRLRSFRNKAGQAAERQKGGINILTVVKKMTSLCSLQLEEIRLDSDFLVDFIDELRNVLLHLESLKVDFRHHFLSSNLGSDAYPQQVRNNVGRS